MLETVNRYLSGMATPLLLMGSGLFLLLYLRGRPLLTPRRAFAAWRGNRGEGRRESVRAVCLALAGTLGVGNLAGVAGAIAMGGAGAVFWMWVSALLAMILKYAEIVLAMRHRRLDASGKCHGSAMDYIRDCLNERGLRFLGKIVSSLFALLFLGTALSMGSGLQANAVAHTLSGVFGLSPLWVGLCLGGGLLWVLSRGREGVLGVCARLVPFMTVLYVILSVAVLVLRAERIPQAFADILGDAFSLEATAGGVGGFFLSRRVRFGVMRGLISNEAGCGTAPTAHTVADGISPAGQGVMGMIEVFVDTLLLCTLTALVILIGDGAAESGSYMMLTLSAFTSVLGAYATYPLAAAVVCFGFATLVCWAHYGAESVRFLSKAPRFRRLFYIAFAGAVVFGSVSDSEILWQWSDLAMGAMTLINLLALIAMRREIREETEKIGKG